MRDLSLREVVAFAPLLVLAFWIGLYPAPFLRRLETSVGRVVARVNSVYAPVVAQGADCKTAATRSSATGRRYAARHRPRGRVRRWRRRSKEASR